MGLTPAGKTDPRCRSICTDCYQTIKSNVSSTQPLQDSSSQISDVSLLLQWSVDDLQEMLMKEEEKLRTLQATKQMLLDDYRTKRTEQIATCQTIQTKAQKQSNQLAATLKEVTREEHLLLHDKLVDDYFPPSSSASRIHPLSHIIKIDSIHKTINDFCIASEDNEEFNAAMSVLALFGHYLLLLLRNDDSYLNDKIREIFIGFQWMYSSITVPFENTGPRIFNLVRIADDSNTFSTGFMWLIYVLNEAARHYNTTISIAANISILSHEIGDHLLQRINWENFLAEIDNLIRAIPPDSFDILRTMMDSSPL